MARGERQWVIDVDGNVYLDALGNFTSLIHGHAHPEIQRALTQQSAFGTAFGAPSTVALELAEAIQARCPSVEQLRFCNSGTEANLYAVRAARAFTGRSKLLKMDGAYHGGYDPFRVSVSPTPTGVSPGVGRAEEPGLSPASINEVLVAPYNDLESVKLLLAKHGDELAAVVVEPVMSAGGMIVAEPDFIEGLRTATRAAGVLLIFDEVVTFRLAAGGAQSLLGVTPDLTTFGKLIGGGLPIGAFGGRADVMSHFDPMRPDRISQSGTFNGNTCAMAAGLVTLSLLTSEEIARINSLGEKLRAGLTGILQSAGLHGEAAGIGSLTQVHFVRGPLRNAADTAGAPKWATPLLHLGLMNRGVLTASRGMLAVSTAMTSDDIDFVLQAADEVIRQIATSFVDE
jgi:glutamate-1-semialdehyde 2,1-aminomutase